MESVTTLNSQAYCYTTGNPGSVIVPQYGSSKFTVFVWGNISHFDLIMFT